MPTHTQDNAPPTVADLESRLDALRKTESKSPTFLNAEKSFNAAKHSLKPDQQALNEAEKYIDTLELRNAKRALARAKTAAKDSLKPDQQALNEAEKYIDTLELRNAKRALARAKTAAPAAAVAAASASSSPNSKTTALPAAIPRLLCFRNPQQEHERHYEAKEQEKKTLEAAIAFLERIKQKTTPTPSPTNKEMAAHNLISRAKSAKEKAADAHFRANERAQGSLVAGDSFKNATTSEKLAENAFNAAARHHTIITSVSPTAIAAVIDSIRNGAGTTAAKIKEAFVSPLEAAAAVAAASASSLDSAPISAADAVAKPIIDAVDGAANEITAAIKKSRNAKNAEVTNQCNKDSLNKAHDAPKEEKASSLNTSQNQNQDYKNRLKLFKQITEARNAYIINERIAAEARNSAADKVISGIHKAIRDAAGTGNDSTATAVCDAVCEAVSKHVSAIVHRSIREQLDKAEQDQTLSSPNIQEQINKTVTDAICSSATYAIKKATDSQTLSAAAVTPESVVTLLQEEKNKLYEGNDNYNRIELEVAFITMSPEEPSFIEFAAREQKWEIISKIIARAEQESGFDLIEKQNPISKALLELTEKFPTSGPEEEINKANAAATALVNAGAETSNKYVHKNCTALHYAITAKNDELIKIILRHPSAGGAAFERVLYQSDPSDKAPIEYASPLEHAANIQNWKAVNTIVDDISDQSTTINKIMRYALLRLAQNFPIEEKEKQTAIATAKKLIKKIQQNQCHEQTYTPIIDIWNHTSNSALHYAIENGNNELIKIILECPGTLATVADENSDGWSPLELLAEGGYYSIIEQIIEKVQTQGSNSEIKNAYNYTLARILSKHVANEHMVAKKLIEQKPSICQTHNHLGGNPLHVAIKNIENKEKAKEIVDLIFEHCPDASNAAFQKNKDEQTPLELAVINGQLDIVTTIIENAKKGSSGIDLTNEDKKAAIEAADALINAGANTSNGSNALHVAIQNKDKALLENLLKLNGASEAAFEKNDSGKTPWDLADKPTKNMILDKFLQREFSSKGTGTGRGTDKDLKQKILNKYGESVNGYYNCSKTYNRLKITKKVNDIITLLYERKIKNEKSGKEGASTKTWASLFSSPPLDAQHTQSNEEEEEVERDSFGSAPPSPKGFNVNDRQYWQ